MKKIVRITENDLTRIVKRVLKEQSLKDKIKSTKQNIGKKIKKGVNNIKDKIQKVEKTAFQKQVEELLDDGYEHTGTQSQILSFEKFSKTSKGIQRSEGPGNHALNVRTHYEPRDFLEFKKGNNTVVFFYN